ncbi:unnamed protein product [Psylliodes chrysocephalus]|uniref:THAP-type domain-containing protein n=1 Tax=Psylliodes chrysocephalus TaxID=3402493 RepID=A0A9P0GBB3_9CUCU|nr:unnamed protein product [Psylliodes chrysocephala]
MLDDHEVESFLACSSSQMDVESHKNVFVIQKCRVCLRWRREDETNTQFMTALRGLAGLCEFGGNLNERLRDQLVIGVNNAEWQQEIILNYTTNQASLKNVDTCLTVKTSVNSQCNLWATACGRSDLINSNSGHLNKTRRICSDHFEDFMFTNSEKRDYWYQLYQEIIKYYILLNFYQLHKQVLRVVKEKLKIYNERHTAETERVLTEWNVYDKVAALVTDNDANMSATARLGGWKHLSCFAHSINLVVHYELKEISETLVKAKSIVEFFKRSPQSAATLRLIESQMSYDEINVKQDMPAMLYVA